MKKLLILGAAVLGILGTQHSFAQEFTNDQGGGCPPERSCNDCWCRMVRYQPCYYCTQRCIEEQIPCQKKCCRMVPQHYQVQCCRMVPQYYCVTRCRYVPQHYCVTEYKCCKRFVPERHCRYVPVYYWKHVCGVESCPANNNGSDDRFDNRDDNFNQRTDSNTESATQKQ